MCRSEQVIAIESCLNLSVIEELEIDGNFIKKWW